MDDITSRALVSHPESRRALQLDTLSAILPMERAGGPVSLTQPALGTPTGGPRQHPAAAAQEQTGGHPRRAGPVPWHLPVRPAGRYPRLAIPLLAFASGGRRRSEVARLRVEQISDEPAVPVDPKNPHSPTLPCVAAQLGRTKTGVTDEAGRVLLVGSPVEALCEWLERADISKGPTFRAINRWEAVEDRALTPQSINVIVKRRCALAGLEAREFSAHGLRSGHLTEAAQRGVSLPEAMQQSQHRSVQQASSYYKEAERRHGRAVRLGI